MADQERERVRRFVTIELDDAAPDEEVLNKRAVAAFGAVASITHHYMADDSAGTSIEFDGVFYGIEVSRDEEGITNLRYTSDPPPQGLNRVRYEWTGRLSGGKVTSLRQRERRS